MQSVTKESHRQTFLLDISEFVIINNDQFFENSHVHLDPIFQKLVHNEC